MTANKTLFERGKTVDSESDNDEGVEEDVWDDRKLNDAYDKAVRIAHAEVAKRLAMSTNTRHENREDSKQAKKKSKGKQAGPSSAAVKTEWKAGMACRALFEDDGIEYEAFVIRIINEKECVVRFLGYDNCEIVPLVGLLPSQGKAERQRQIEQAALEKGEDQPNSDWKQVDSDRAQSPGSTDFSSGRRQRSPKKKKSQKEPVFDHMPELPFQMPNLSMMPNLMMPNLGSLDLPMPPPPPMAMPRDRVSSEDQAVSSMLLSWYMSGYYTGLYQGMKRQIMDVVVVGCGASGIAAVRRLHDAGLKVLALEAGDRIGGRINSVEFGAGKVDLGAAWCHGEKDNLVFELANPLGLLGRPEPDNKWFVLSNGDLVPNDTGEDIVAAFNGEVAKADKNSKKGISECVRTAAKSNQTLRKDPKLTSMFLEWYERNSHLGGQKNPKEGKSLKGLEEFWDSDGEFMLNWKGRGYATILDVLLNKYPDPSKAISANILLNKEVESIKWSSSQPGMDPENPLVHVKCKDGSLYAAKSVIVTVSIGVLKERHSQLFSPPLPAEKINTINNLQFCVLGKIYIEFEKPWWPKSPANFTILWQDEDKAKFSKEDQWITEIYGFLTVESQPNVLLAWIYGEGAEKMEKVSLEGVRAGVEKLLDIVRKEFDVTPVKNIVRTQWASNPLVRGAYAYRSVASEENGGSAKILSEPLYHGNDFPIVCFAGEATSHHRHTAVHGAIEAGFREADRLIKSFKKLG